MGGESVTTLPPWPHNQAVPVVSCFPTHDQAFLRTPFQSPSADFFNTFSALMSNMLDKVQGIVNMTVTQKSLLSSQDLSQSSGSTLGDSQEPSLFQDDLEAKLQLVDSMPNIPYVQSVNRDRCSPCGSREE